MTPARMTPEQQTLYDTHWGRAVAAATVFARRYPHLRDEFTAAVSVALWQAAVKYVRGTLSPKTGQPVAFNSYLYVFLRRSLLDVVRRERRHGQTVRLQTDEGHPAHPQHPDPRGPLWGDVDFDMMVAVLPPRLARVIDGKFRRGETLSETGAALGISKQAVYRLYRRALEILRESMADDTAASAGEGNGDDHDD